MSVIAARVLRVLPLVVFASLLLFSSNSAKAQQGHFTVNFNESCRNTAGGCSFPLKTTPKGFNASINYVACAISATNHDVQLVSLILKIYPEKPGGAIVDFPLVAVKTGGGRGTPNTQQFWSASHQLPGIQAPAGSLRTVDLSVLGPASDLSGNCTIAGYNFAKP